MARRQKPAFEPVAWVVYADDTDDLRRSKRFTDHLEAQRYARQHTWMGRPAEIDALYRFRVNYYDAIDRDNYGSKIVVAMNEEAVREAFYESNNGDSWEIASVEKLRPDTGPRGPDPKISPGTGTRGLGSSWERQSEDAARFDREIRKWIYAGDTMLIEEGGAAGERIPVRGVTSTGPDEPGRFPAKVWVHDGEREVVVEAPTRAQAFRQAVRELEEEEEPGLAGGLGFWKP